MTTKESAPVAVAAGELLPCPFCGNDGKGTIEHALHVSHTENDWHTFYHCYSVQCDKCTATMGYSESEEAAIEAWNTRAALAQPRAAMPKVCRDPQPLPFEDAIQCCHVRSSVFRVADPAKRYPKNHPTPLRGRVPDADQAQNDWLEHDPREGSEQAWVDFLARPRPATTDYRYNLAVALFEAQSGATLRVWSDETRDYWLGRADAALALQSPPAAKVDRYANDEAAKAIYDSWKSQEGWVPWVEHGNSDRQMDARDLARLALQPAAQGDDDDA